jgi:CheY-like chemotaxis protein
MNGILGMTQLLMDTNLDAEQREFLNTVQSSAKSLLTIINDVLDFSKVDAGRIQLDPVEFDVVNMLEEVTSLVSERADPKGLDLFCIQPEPLPARFVGDEGRIRQILINLVGNAVKFTMDGQVVIRTTVDRSDGDSYTLRFEVEDSGIGIAPDKIGALFQSFVQADNSTTRRFGGTGLGLAISKRLVELLGGEMGVRSDIGMGSTFWFTVPIERVSTPRRALDFSADLRGKSIWVGAEHPMVLTALRQVVGVHGVRIEGFRNKGELKQAMAESQVDYVLLDESGEDWSRDSFAKELADKHSVSLLALLRNSERDECRPGPHSPWSGSLIRPFRTALVLHVLRGLKGKAQSSAPAVTSVQTAEVTQLIRPTKILLAEDSPVNRTIALKMLSKLGFVADIAHNGLEAVEACKDTRYDVVLMDCLMPVVDGYQATQRIRKYFGARRGPVIIALTANAMADDRAKCIDAGMDDYLPKPFSPTVLGELLDTWVKKMEAEQQGKVFVR